MKRYLLILLVLPPCLYLAGCATTRGNAGYSSAGLLDKFPGEREQPRDPAEEWLTREADVQFPAKIVAVDVGQSWGEVRETLRGELENAIEEDARFLDPQVLLSRNLPPSLDGIRELGARMHAKYVLLFTDAYNNCDRTYWPPAFLAVCTLGLIPIPVGGEQSFCTVEMLLMDVPTGLILLTAQGHGHAQRTAVWGWMTGRGRNRYLDDQALRDALPEAIADFRGKLTRLGEEAAQAGEGTAPVVSHRE